MRIIAQPVSARELSWRDYLDDLLAELNDAELQADSLGGMSGPVRSEQRAASARIDRALRAPDRLEVA